MAVGYDRPLYVLPFDHRGTFQKNMFGWSGTLTPEQTALWKKAADPLFKTWADGVKKTGVDPDAAMTELKASLAKYNALAQ